MTHPSIEGLKEAVTAAVRTARNSGAYLAEEVDTAFDAQAAYLTEHGVGWFGDELVRAEQRDYNPSLYELVSVPSCLAKDTK